MLECGERRVFLSGYRATKECPPHPHSPPAASHCVSLRGHPAGFNGDTRAAGCAARLAPPMNQMRQVQLRWITVIPAWVCSSVHTRAAYLMSPKERGGEEKRERHITLKYLQKLVCVEMIIKGCLTTPSCLLRVSKKHYHHLVLWITWCQHAFSKKKKSIPSWCY